MRTMGYGNEAMTPHGVRAMARTLLDEVLRFPLDVIEAQLAHKVRDPTGRAYNRTTKIEERTAMMQQWADYLDKLRAGAAAGGSGSEAALCQKDASEDTMKNGSSST